MIETSYKYYVFMTKRAWNQTLKTTGNTGHFCKNTEFYRTSKRQDITGNTTVFSNDLSGSINFFTF